MPCLDCCNEHVQQSQSILIHQAHSILPIWIGGGGFQTWLLGLKSIHITLGGGQNQAIYSYLEYCTIIVYLAFIYPKATNNTEVLRFSGLICCIFATYICTFLAKVQNAQIVVADNLQLSFASLLSYAPIFNLFIYLNNLCAFPPFSYLSNGESLLIHCFLVDQFPISPLILFNEP